MCVRWGFFLILAKPSLVHLQVWVRCPADLGVRMPDRTGPLADKETEYIQRRTSKSIGAWRSYLSRANLTDFSIDDFLSRAEAKGAQAGSTLPNIGKQISPPSCETSLRATVDYTL